MARSSMVRNAIPALRVGIVAAVVLGGAAACDRVTSAPEGAAAAITEGTVSIAGRIVGFEDIQIAGARIATPNGATAVSGPGGEFVLGGLAATERLAVTVSAPGYASTTAIYKVVPGATLRREIRMLRRGPRVMIDAAVGGVVTFAGGGRVTIPPNAFAGVKPGEPVGVQVTYYDPAVGGQLNAAPGDFSAVEANGETSQLETAGMVDVFVTNSQNAQVSLAAGQRVMINFPDRDGAAATAWGLYRFDTTTGRWVRTGDAPVDRDGTQRASVPSVDRPWNADQPLVTTCIRVNVADLGGAPRANEPVRAEGVSYRGISSGWTDAAGNVDLRVKSSSQADVSAGTASQTVSTPTASTTCTPSAALVF